MRKTSLSCGFTLGALMIGMAGAAKADDHGFYEDVSAGLASYPTDLKGPLNGVPFTRKGHASALAYSFTLGYRVNQRAGVEVGTVDFGKPVVNLGDPSDSTKSMGRANVSAKGHSLAVLAFVPTGDWDTYFKVGILQAKLGTRYSVRTSATSVFEYGISTERPSVLLGVGTRYAFAEHWALHLSVDYARKVGGENWANLVSPRLGFSYRF